MDPRIVEISPEFADRLPGVGADVENEGAVRCRQPPHIDEGILSGHVAGRDPAEGVSAAQEEVLELGAEGHRCGDAVSSGRIYFSWPGSGMYHSTGVRFASIRVPGDILYGSI